ncbi:hypothetical protein VNO80_06550 [Phaseolus coccineus]|uniref:Uncharacterized protein n=1 Tax=Phaseolus coccineus TaxID=3886 RepID=A0AAN9NHX8_PHACN
MGTHFLTSKEAIVAPRLSQVTRWCSCIGGGVSFYGICFHVGNLIQGKPSNKNSKEKEKTERKVDDKTNLKALKPNQVGELVRY